MKNYNAMPGDGQGYSQDFYIRILGDKLNVKGPPTKNGKGGYDARRCPVCGGSDCLSIDPGTNGHPLLICRSTGCSFGDIVKAIRDEGLPFPGPAGPFSGGAKGSRPAATFDQDAAREARAKGEEEAAARHAEAAKNAARILALSEPLTSPTPYLKRKSFTGEALTRLAEASGVRRIRSRVVVPLVDAAGGLATVETIYANGLKIFLEGGAKKGSFHPIGIRPEEIANLRRRNYFDEENPAFRAALCIAEGWATAAAVFLSTGRPAVMCVDASNMPEVARIMRRLNPEVDIILCADEDPAGIEAATKAALAVGGKVALPRIGAEAAAKRKGYDFWDLWHDAGPEAVRVALASAKSPVEPERPGPGDCLPHDESAAFERELERLAALPALEYERQWQDAAKRFGVQTTRLDRLVKDRKGKELEAERAAALPFEETEPWPEPVDGAELLDEMERTVGRFIICDPPVLTAAALWAAFTWFIDVVQVAPIALITAPEKACGKSQMLSILARLSARSMQTSSISPAALFRAVEQWRPTLFIDEADTFMRDNEELRGVINSGHTRDTAFVIRAVGEEHVPTTFSTWGAKAIAGIRADKLAATITDRAVVLRLRRKLKVERVASLRGLAAREIFSVLRRKLARFAQDAAEVVERADAPELELLSDRQMDNWSPLLAVALAAGGTWPDRAQRAALALSGVEDEPGGIGPELLANVRDVFRDYGDPDRIATADLIEALCANEEWRWATYNHGREVAPRQVASLLKGYGIKTNNKIRIGDRVARGYMKADFEDAFMRYV